MYTCDTNFPTHQSSLPPAHYCIVFYRRVIGKVLVGRIFPLQSLTICIHSLHRVYFRETETIAKAPQDHRIGPHCPKK